MLHGGFLLGKFGKFIPLSVWRTKYVLKRFGKFHKVRERFYNGC